MSYKYFQPNDKDVKDEYGDCVIRALCAVESKPWLQVFDEITEISRIMQCPYGCKPCYEEYLKKMGYSYTGIKHTKGTKRPTVYSFSEKHNRGRYFLNVAGHCVSVIDGKYYDTWDSGKKSLYGYWKKDINNT